MKKLLIRSDVWESMSCEALGALVCQRSYLSQYGVDFDFEPADIEQEFEFIDEEEDFILKKLMKGDKVFFLNGKWRW